MKTHCWSCPGVLLQWKRRQSPRAGQNPAATALSTASNSLFEEGACTGQGLHCGCRVTSSYWTCLYSHRTSAESYKKPCLYIYLHFLVKLIFQIYRACQPSLRTLYTITTVIWLKNRLEAYSSCHITRIARVYCRPLRGLCRNLWWIKLKLMCLSDV